MGSVGNCGKCETDWAAYKLAPVCLSLYIGPPRSQYDFVFHRTGTTRISPDPTAGTGRTPNAGPDGP